MGNLRLVAQLALTRHDAPFGGQRAFFTLKTMAQQDRLKSLPDVAFCEEKKGLINEFIAANHVLWTLQSQQTRAIINDDLDFMRFDDLIHLAREKKEQVKYALIAHLEAHHC